MNDIDSSERQEEARKPNGSDIPDASGPKRLAGAGLASGCFLFPGIALSAFFAGMALYEQGSGWESMLAIGIVQIVVLVVMWNYLRKATSWGVVLLGFLIAAGFYLLMMGICASTL